MILPTAASPSAPMLTEAVSAGYYASPLWQRKYPRLQILTIEDLLDGKPIDIPPAYGTFKQAEKIKKDSTQGTLGI